jgi:MoaD family protein
MSIIRCGAGIKKELRPRRNARNWVLHNRTLKITRESAMKVHVKAFATFREVMDNQVDLEFTEGATLRILLADLTRRYEGLGELMFATPDTLRDFVNILKNGRNVHFLSGLDTPLEDGDIIALFPPIAGG